MANSLSTGLPAGWYADPRGEPRRIRYWDGGRWTDLCHTLIEPTTLPSLARKPAKRAPRLRRGR